MQGSELSAIFGYIGELLFRSSRLPVNKIEQYVNRRGDKYASYFIISNRSLKYMFGIGTGICVVTGSTVVYNKYNEYQLYVKSNESNILAAHETIYPRIKSSLQNAHKYAQNGNIALMDNYLNTAADLLEEYPIFKQNVLIHDYGNDNDNGNDSDNDDTVAATTMGAKRTTNELDLIHNLGMRMRCRKLLHRAQKYANKGNVNECSYSLSEIWENIQSMDNTNDKNDDKDRTIAVEVLHDIMRECHANYVQYLLHKSSEIDGNISLVFQSLEDIKNYCIRYNVFTKDVKQGMKHVWEQKQQQFGVET